jgi:hypothetical protein
MAGERDRQGGLIGRDLAEDRKGEAPSEHEHPSQLTKPHSRVRDELQPLLTQRDLKTATREGQSTYIALPSFDRDACDWGIGTGHVQHAGAEVHADDVPEVAISLDGHAGDDPRSARRIQDPIAGRQGDVRKHSLDQGPAQRADRLAFVQVWGVPFELIPGLGHGVLHALQSCGKGSASLSGHLASAHR